MITIEAYNRLKTDLLIDCAAELQAKTDRVAELEADNAFLRARLRIMELRLERRTLPVVDCVFLKLQSG
jgi:hypothetical protein